MADKDSNDDEFSNFRRRNRRDGDENTSDDLETSSDNPGEPDIGLGHAQRRSEGQKYGEMNAGNWPIPHTKLYFVPVKTIN